MRPSDGTRGTVCLVQPNLTDAGEHTAVFSKRHPWLVWNQGLPISWWIEPGIYLCLPTSVGTSLQRGGSA